MTERWRVAVFGAGVAGLAAAQGLARQGIGPVLILERKSRIGGLAATERFAGIDFDLGSHRIHPGCDPEVLAFLRETLGERLERRPRRGRLCLRGKFLDYPPSPMALVGVLGIAETVRCGFSLLASRLGVRSARGRYKTYESVLAPAFGSRFYELFYAPYARKLYGLSPDQVSAAAAKIRVTSQKPLAILSALLRSGNGSGPGGFYFYPTGGFGAIAESFKDELRALPVEIARSSEPLGLTRRAERGFELAYRRDGRTIEARVDHVISSIPLPALLSLLRPAPVREVSNAAGDLSWRGIRLLQLVIDRKRCLEGETYYFPEEIFPFGRISEPTQFSSEPTEKTGLNIEVICSPGDDLWEMSEEEFLDHLLESIEELGLCQRREVEEYRTVHLPAVYPVYDLGFEQRREQVLDWLEERVGIYSLGRAGMFLHANSDHSIHLGWRVADRISSGLSPEGWRDELINVDLRLRD